MGFHCQTCTHIKYFLENIVGNHIRMIDRITCPCFHKTHIGFLNKRWRTSWFRAHIHIILPCLFKTVASIIIPSPCQKLFHEKQIESWKKAYRKIISKPNEIYLVLKKDFFIFQKFVQFSFMHSNNPTKKRHWSSCLKVTGFISCFFLTKGKLYFLIFKMTILTFFRKKNKTAAVIKIPLFSSHLVCSIGP